MKCSRLVDGRRMNVALNGEMLEEVKCFKYLGAIYWGGTAVVGHHSGRVGFAWLTF